MPDSYTFRMLRHENKRMRDKLFQLGLKITELRGRVQFWIDHPPIFILDPKLSEESLKKMSDMITNPGKIQVSPGKNWERIEADKGDPAYMDDPYSEGEGA